jgi:hypothetical protein
MHGQQSTRIRVSEKFIEQAPEVQSPRPRVGSRWRWRGLDALKALVVILVAAAAWLPGLNINATQRIEAGLQRALTVYATARALNAAISVMQGTELAIEPAGVGIVTKPGEFLDPLNDLIEKFSDLMLAASVAFGIELVLIKVGGHWLVCALLGASAAAWVAASLARSKVEPSLGRLFLVLVFVRFAVPLVMLGSDFVHREFMAKDYQDAASQIGQVEQEVRKADDELNKAHKMAADARPPSSILDRMKDWLPKIPDVGEIVRRLMSAVERAINNVVHLMVIFLLETLLLPLVFLWILRAAGRALIPGKDASA